LVAIAIDGIEVAISTQDLICRLIESEFGLFGNYLAVKRHGGDW